MDVMPKCKSKPHLAVAEAPGEEYCGSYCNVLKSGPHCGRCQLAFSGPGQVP